MKFTAPLSLLLSMLVLAPAAAVWAETATTTNTSEVALPSDNQPSVLVGNVMSQLGLNQSQAEGGLGSLLSLAQSNLGESEFGTLADSIPDAGGLLAAAPETNTDSGMSGLLSKAGALGSTLEGGAMVYDAFNKLGIPADLVVPMVNIAKSYLETHGAAGSVDLLMKGVGALL